MARADVRSQLAAAPDLARSLARLVLGRAAHAICGIRDGWALPANWRGGSERLLTCPRKSRAPCTRWPHRMPPLRERSPRRWLTNCRTSGATAALCARTTMPRLDETRALRDESRRVVAALQARYAEESSVKRSSCATNNVLGYFVEVPEQHGER